MSKIEELLKQKENIEKQIKAERSKRKTFIPKDGDEFYYISSEGYIVLSFAINDDIKNFISFGNCFSSPEEAEFMVERLKVIKELENFAKENNDEIDWDSYSGKYYIYYDYFKNSIKVGSTAYTKANKIYFSSFDICREAINTVGEDRIKKYYLGV